VRDSEKSGKKSEGGNPGSQRWPLRRAFKEGREVNGDTPKGSGKIGKTGERKPPAPTRPPSGSRAAKKNQKKSANSKGKETTQRGGQWGTTRRDEV